MSSPPVLQFDAVHKQFRAGRPGCSANVSVLRGVSLTVARGELVALHAAPAAGRTTLLLCAAGLLRPEQGSVRWPAIDYSPDAPSPSVRYVADRAAPFGYLSVRDALTQHISSARSRHPGRASDADELMALTELGTVAAVRVATLGPNDRARLLLAIALSSAPSLLLIDALDDGTNASQRTLGATLQQVAAHGVAIVWAPRAAAPTDADSVYRLERGRLQRTAVAAIRGRLPAPRLAAIVPRPIGRWDSGVSFPA